MNILLSCPHDTSRYDEKHLTKSIMTDSSSNCRQLRRINRALNQVSIPVVWVGSSYDTVDWRIACIWSASSFDVSSSQISTRGCQIRCILFTFCRDNSVRQRTVLIKNVNTLLLLFNNKDVRVWPYNVSTQVSNPVATSCHFGNAE